jgi:hypothetical protein
MILVKSLWKLCDYFVHLCAILIILCDILKYNLYLWCVRVVIYERPTTDRIHRICQVVEAPAIEVDIRGRHERGSS